MGDRNLIKYSITLLVVAIICIAVGGISLSRNLNREDGRVIRDFGVTEKVSAISDENLKLKNKNKELSDLNLSLVQENERLTEEKVKNTAEIEAYNLYVSYKNGETDFSYREFTEKINGLNISDQLKTRLTK